MAAKVHLGRYDEDRRRDTYLALREWQSRTGQAPVWDQILFPDEVLRWASRDPEVCLLLRRRY